MIRQSEFGVDAWCLREAAIDLDVLAQTESLFALSNGHIGLRGNLDEGEPFGVPGTYLNSVYELHPLPYAEAGYGYPESGQTVVNVTDGKLIRLLVDDEPFDIRYGDLESHERTLDFRAGVLERTAVWRSPAGTRIRITSTRMVSLTQRAVAAIHYRVEPLDAPARVVIQSELVANQEMPQLSDDPRSSTWLDAPLQAEYHDTADHGVVLVHSVRHSGLRVGAAMTHEVTSEAEVAVTTDCTDDFGRVTFAAALRPNQSVALVKYLAYGWSGARTVPALRDQVAAALTAASTTGWDRLLADQRRYLDEYWVGADVEIDGDAELQQAVRFAMFHVLQASARAEQRPLAAKGLTGHGYDGHAFWDTETFVLPVLIHTVPAAAADALRWRHRTLPAARERAHQLGLSGAAFPWRTINGDECSGYWPAGTAAFHVNADVADAVLRYCSSTGDTEFERTVGLELLVETARLWRSIGHHDLAGRFRIDGVTGPDEYSAIADNNVFTNLMASRNLVGAADCCVRHPDEADALGVDAEEVASWRDASDDMFVPFDETLGVTPQSEGFTVHEKWGFASTRPDQYPLLLHFPYFDLYRKQVVKQPDLVLAMHLVGDAFSPELKRRNFDYYEPLTVRDSSLSACTEAVMAAEVGHLELAARYAQEAAFMDLRDVERNTRDGLHLASLAGAWIALVAGFGGMRDHGDTVCFSPRLPRFLTAMAFTVRRARSRVRVTVDGRFATYLVDGPDPVEVHHYGTLLRLVPGQARQEPIPPLEWTPEPRQPPGREVGAWRTGSGGGELLDSTA